MLYMVIGCFRRGFGRSGSRSEALFTGELARDTAGLTFVGSWVEAGLRRSFQIVECSEPAPLLRWAAQWRHCVKFEVVPVVPTAEAVTALQPLLD